MNTGAMGDLARSYAMQSRNNGLKQEMERLAAELTSGRVADMRKAAQGNAAYVNDLERSLKKLDGYDVAAREATQFADGVQTALGRFGDLNMAFRDTALRSGNTPFGQTSNLIFSDAQQTLDDMISTLNTNVAGRSLFAGAATDTAAFAPATDMLGALGAVMAGAGSVDDMLAAAENWFNDPAGFNSVVYRGSNTALAPMTLSDNETVQFDLRGNDPVIRDTLRNMALLAIADDPALNLTAAQKSEIFEKTVGKVIAASDSIVALRAETGLSESRLEAQSSRNSAERASLEMARSNLLSIDPFKAATELEQVQFQLQSLYAITSRMSQLSLLNFI